MNYDFLGKKLKKILSELDYVKGMSDVYENLSFREIQIAALIKDGKSMRQISEVISRSLNTVNNQKQSLKSKLRAKTDRDLVKFANAFKIEFSLKTISNKNKIN